MNSVDQAIESRMSVRAFTKEHVSREIILNLLDLSARAPSGTNTQPWKAYVLEGEKLQQLCNLVCAAYDSIAQHPELEKEWEDLRALAEQYKKLEQHIKDKQATFDRLKAMPAPNID